MKGRKAFRKFLRGNNVRSERYVRQSPSIHVLFQLELLPPYIKLLSVDEMIQVRVQQPTLLRAKSLLRLLNSNYLILATLGAGLFCVERSDCD